MNFVSVGRGRTRRCMSKRPQEILLFRYSKPCTERLPLSEQNPKKEVFQPHLPVRLPCYDFTPVTNPALGRCSLTVSSRTSGVVDFHGVTGGVYKTLERIQRSVLICVY